MRLKVITEEYAQPWYAGGLKFTCTECGNCCTGGPGYVWISDVEIDRLAAHFGITRRQVIARYCRRFGDRYSLKENRNPRGEYDCIFLREQPAPQTGGQTVVHSKRTCAIYQVRPLQCRTWPFWDGNLAGPENWQRASQRCPGMNQGKHYSLEQIEALRQAEDWPQQAPGSGAGQ